jgi:hypothetical protein
MDQPPSEQPGESPFAPGAATTPAAVVPPQPRLSISHLMLWMLGSAVILGTYRLIQSDDQQPVSQRGVYQLYMVLGSFFYGVQVAAIFIFGARLVTRRGPLAREPGHWLLVKGGGSCLISWSIFGLVRFFHLDDFTSMGISGLSILLLGFYVPSLTLDLWAIVMLRQERMWRAYIALLAVPSVINVLLAALMLAEQLLESNGPYFMAGSATTLFMQWNSLQTGLGQVLGLLCLGVLVVVDYRRGRRRDWVHFAGVATEGGAFLLSMVIQILTALVARMS